MQIDRCVTIIFKFLNCKLLENLVRMIGYKKWPMKLTLLEITSYFMQFAALAIPCDCGMATRRWGWEVILLF